MDVYLWIQPTELEVIVSDHGVGIRPNVPEPDLEVQGLGLSLIQALTDRVEFLGGMGEGTRVRMRFALDGGPEALSDGDRGDGPDTRPPPGELSIAVSSGPLAAPVLGRVIAMLAARAEFSLEGISEAELVTDAVAAHAPRAIVGDRIQLGIDRPNGQLVVRVGPLAEGGATRVIQASALDDLPPVLERLTEHRRVESAGDGELLCLVLGASLRRAVRRPRRPGRPRSQSADRAGLPPAGARRRLGREPPPGAGPRSERVHQRRSTPEARSSR